MRNAGAEEKLVKRCDDGFEVFMSRRMWQWESSQGFEHVPAS